MRSMNTQLDLSLPRNNATNIQEDSEQKGKIPIQYLCQKRMDSIHNMCAVNTDTTSYLEHSL